MAIQPGGAFPMVLEKRKKFAVILNRFATRDSCASCDREWYVGGDDFCVVTSGGGFVCSSCAERHCPEMLALARAGNRGTQTYPYSVVFSNAASRTGCALCDDSMYDPGIGLCVVTEGGVHICSRCAWERAPELAALARVGNALAMGLRDDDALEDQN